MGKNIWKGNHNGIEAEIKEQWGEIRNNDIAEFEEKLEKMSDLLIEDGDLKYDVEEHYTIFD